MKTTLIKPDLQKALSIATRFVSQRPSIPVLGNVLLSAKKGQLTLMATNLETSMQVTISAKSDIDWEFTVPARVFNEFVVNAKGEEINLELEKETLKITFDDLSGEISGIASSEFPKMPEIKVDKAEEVGLAELAEAINKVAFAASSDEGKPILTGILIKTTAEGTIFVATDGYRLAKKVLNKTYGLDEVVIPAKTLVDSLKVATEMEEEKISLIISKEENQLLIIGQNFRVASRLLDGKFPAFQPIIPNTFSTEVSLNKTILNDSIKAVAVFAKDTGNVVKMNVEKDKIILSANTAQVGEGSANLKVSSTGETIKVAFNSHYLLEGVNSFKEEELEMMVSGALTPTLLKGKKDDSFIYIVMPVKVQN